MGEPFLAAPLQTLLDKLDLLLDSDLLESFKSELRTWISKPLFLVISFLISAMGESFLATYLQTLLDKLVLLLNSDRLERFVSELRAWRSKLLQFRRVLSDAEEKQMRDREVKKWLDKLRDLAYNADDVLEELRHEALQRQNNSSSDPAASSSQLQDLLAQIQGITKSFSYIAQEISDLGLEGRSEVKSNWPKLNSIETTSLVDSSQIVGREKDVAEILKLLDIRETTKAEKKLNHSCGMEGYRKPQPLDLKAPLSEATLVIPIVGMGGVGKTTLAQCIYNHNTLKDAFDLKAWVCVSDNFDITGVTKALLEEFNISSDGSLNKLQERLRENISSKRFLIVLDDIWNEDREKWENFFIPLKSGRQRSAVIVTARSSKVASITGSTSNYQLALVEDDKCLSILARHALRAQNFDAHPNLKVIGEKMVKRCGGLPLAAKILGGLLRDQDQDQTKWEEVYGSSLWGDSISEKIAPVLGLSFNYLSSHLKQCFAYCSIFPKDNEFDEEDLIFRWMAEGFLGEPNVEKQMEDGHKYFHHLLSRSLLQRSSYNSTKFVMHDLIHDLAQIVAGRVCLKIEKVEAEVVDVEAVRHLSFCHIFGPNKEFEGLKNTKRLRTLLAFRRTFFMDQKLLHNLLPQLRYLRVFSLNSYKIIELPSSIGDLKYLQYLNLSYTCVKLLPESLCGLHSLQFLILKGCLDLHQLPLSLKDLVNLRYLDISYYDLPLVINLMNKKNIEELKFDWRNFKNTKLAESLPQILNLLELRKTLRKLVIEEYGGVTLSNWICDSSYSKLVELSLIFCKCKSLPSLGQLPLLKELTIRGMSKIETIGTELYGEASPHAQPFPSLTELCIGNCERCKSLPSLGQLPLLKKLRIWAMPKIETIGTELYGEASPRGQPFPSLTELRIENCENLRTLPDGIMSSNSNLQVLEISYCKSLESFGSGCESIESVPESPNLAHLTSLRDLHVAGCDNLMSLPEGGLPSSLQKLEFGPCAKVEKQMWNEWAPHKLPCITSLSLTGGFGDVVCFPFPAQDSQSLLPPTLTSLSIHRFRNLESLSSFAFRNVTSLARLHIFDCPKLQSLPIEALPPSLGFFYIVGCPKLKFKCEEGGEYWARISLIRGL